MLLSIRHKNRHGVTLLELMVAIALMAGSCCVALPYFFHSFYPRYSLNNASQRLVNDMLHARMRAVAISRQHRIVFDIENNAFWIEVGDRSHQSKVWCQESFERQLSNPGSDAYFPGVKLIAANKTAIVFSPSGGQTPMSVTLGHSQGTTIKIHAAVSGRIRIEKGAL